MENLRGLTDSPYESIEFTFVFYFFNSNFSPESDPKTQRVIKYYPLQKD
tara:strand:+ start:743 stop:889 length:147 start_codon:yes stop_codon:yes gene_type:complete